MNNISRALLTVGGVLAVGWLALGTSAATVARASDLQSAVETACQGAANDAEKAAKLVSAARAEGVSDDVATGLLKAAMGFAINSADNSAGLQAGIDAADTLTRRSPGQTAYCNARLNALCQVACRRVKPESRGKVASDVMKRVEASGDRAAGEGLWDAADARYAIAFRMAQLSGHTLVALDHKTRMSKHFVVAMRKVKAVESTIDAAGAAAKTRLAMLYLTELNDPNKARALLGPGSSEVLRTCVPLAAKDPKQFPVQVLTQLSDWYAKSLAKKSDGFAQEMMLRQARIYAELAAAKPAAAGESADAARQRVKDLDEQLEPFTYVSRTLAKRKYLDLLTITDIDRDGGKNKWRFAEDAFVSEASSDGELKLPAEVDGSYQLILKLAKTKEARDIYVNFPVGSKNLRLHLVEFSGEDLKKFLDSLGGGRAQGPSLQDVWHGQVRGGGRGGGRGPGLWGGRGGGANPGNIEDLLLLRVVLEGTGETRKGFGGAKVPDDPATGGRLDSPYDKLQWAPYDVSISVKVEAGKATVAVAVGSTHKLSWSGDIEAMGFLRPDEMTLGVRYDKASVALRSARLIPRGGQVKYAYEDRPPMELVAHQ